MLKWGILGTARINQKIIPFLKNKPDQKIIAIASRSSEKAKIYAADFGIEKYFGTYEDLIRSNDVDAIYISLPNDQHFRWTKEALLNGKHVLCEKPLALRATEIKELIDISISENKLLVEGFMYRHHKQIEKLQEILQSGKLGKIQHVHSTFHFTIPPGPNIRLDAKSGGGVLWDLGCYIVDLSNLIFARLPSMVSATASFHEGVDMIFAGLMDYGNGASATFDCSFQGARRDSLEITGTKGTLSLARPFKALKESNIQIFSDSGTEEIKIFDDVDVYEREFDHFLALANQIAKPVVSLRESFNTCQTVEALAQAARSQTSVAL